MLADRPIVLLGSGLETGHPDQSSACSYNFAMLKKKWSSLILSPSSSSPVSCSCKNLSFSDGSWIFRLANDCSFFFFRKKSCATGGQTLRRADSRSTCTAHRRRSHCRTHKRKPLLQEKSRKLAYWQDRNSFASRDENCSVLSTSTDVDQVHRLAAISSALLVPR